MESTFLFDSEIFQILDICPFSGIFFKNGKLCSDFAAFFFLESLRNALQDMLKVSDSITHEKSETERYFPYFSQVELKILEF